MIDGSADFAANDYSPPPRSVAAIPGQPNVYNTLRLASGYMPGVTVGASTAGTTQPSLTATNLTETKRDSPQMSRGSASSSPLSPTLSKLLVQASEVVVDRDQRIGEGGFGVVYVGKLRGSTKVAVKQIKGDIDDKTMQAFVREVATWEGLVQRNVLPLMAFCISPPMMITDLIEEGNLRKYLGSNNWDQVLGRRFMADVAAGMSYLHASGILHGDLKSLNVLIDGSRAVITDFGLARLRVEVSKSTSKTGNGLQGTPGFVAPEILAGERLNAPADVYAYAMTFYEVVSRGKYPFEDIKNVAAVGFLSRSVGVLLLSIDQQLILLRSTDSLQGRHRARQTRQTRRRS